VEKHGRAPARVKRLNGSPRLSGLHILSRWKTESSARQGSSAFGPAGPDPRVLLKRKREKEPLQKRGGYILNQGSPTAGNIGERKRKPHDGKREDSKKKKHTSKSKNGTRKNLGRSGKRKEPGGEGKK